MAHLYRGGRILSPNSRPLTALIIEDGRLAWIGDDAEASGITRAGMRITDLDGAIVTPGFVDAHVHATSTGLTLLDLDLAHTCSALEVLEAVESEASRHPGSVILGHGWDESRWSDPSLPSAQEIDRASNGARVYLTRVDAHSALVSTALIAAVPGVSEMNGFDSSGWVTQEAHHALRESALGSLSQATRARAQHAFLAEAARKGIVSVHEMAGPVISSEADCRHLLSAANELGGTRVVAYWGEVAQLGGIELAADIGARGTGGDIFVDGSLGSHTACLHEPYLDAPHTSGREFMDHDTLVVHVDLCVRAGQQTGFHAIGDAATEAVVAAYTRAAEIHGPELVRGQRHRIEHAEAMSSTSIAECARLGIIASMQPAFDRRWGGDGGMYASRLGRDRAASLNALGELRDAGVSIAFGSDAPVTPLDPWGAIRAALEHRTPSQRVDLVFAIDAHTRAGWHAAGVSESGRLAVGAMAHLAIWPSMPGGELPEAGAAAMRTIIDGKACWDSGQLEDLAC